MNASQYCIVRCHCKIVEQAIRFQRQWIISRSDYVFLHIFQPVHNRLNEPNDFPFLLIHKIFDKIETQFFITLEKERIHSFHKLHDISYKISIKAELKRENWANFVDKLLLFRLCENETRMIQNKSFWRIVQNINTPHIFTSTRLDYNKLNFDEKSAEKKKWKLRHLFTLCNTKWNDDVFIFI